MSVSKSSCYIVHCFCCMVCACTWQHSPHALQVGGVGGVGGSFC